MTALSTPEQIGMYRLCVLRTALKMEILGLKKSGRSAYSILKDEGFKGTKAKVLADVIAYIEANKPA